MTCHVPGSVLALALALVLAGCSAEPQPDATPSAAAGAPIGLASSRSELPAGPNVLTLVGLGALRIGSPVPAGSGWEERGAQASDTCRTVTSPDYPGVYAIVEQGAVRRISVGERSNVVLAEGIGPGATRNQVDASFPGFRETPHEYVPGGKYLTAPNAERGDPALRFEIDEKGFVTLMHVGTVPVLTYSEGCA